jgi:hypothetical protein
MGVMNESMPALRWTIETASREFGPDHKTLRRRLVAADQLPGEDGKYSTAQIVGVIFGDLYRQKLRLVREQADKLADENQARRDDLYEADVILHQVYPALFSAIRDVIKASKLTENEKADILRDLEGAKDIKIGGSAR